MNTDEVVKAVANCANVSKQTAKMCIKCYLSVITDEVSKGHDFMLGNFGRLRVSTTKARRGVNPVSGKPIQLKSRKVITFKASSSMKNRLR